VRGQIEQLEAQHQRHLHRVATSSVELSLLEARPARSATRRRSVLRDRSSRAGSGALSDTLIALISGIVWCAALSPIPLGLAAIAYTGVQILRRRRTAAP
jgi:hypothetical protein